MTRPSFANTVFVRAAWGFALVLLAGLVLASNTFVERRIHDAHENNYRAYLSSAAEQIRLKNYAEALRLARIAVEKAPGVAAPYVVLGDVQYRLAEWTQAASSLAAAIDRGDTHIGTRLNLIWSLIMLTDYERAIAVGREALAQGYGGPDLRRYVATALMRANRPGEAVPLLEEALSETPRDQRIVNELLQLYSQLGREEEAARMRARLDSMEADLGSVGPGAAGGS